MNPNSCSTYIKNNTIAKTMKRTFKKTFITTTTLKRKNKGRGHCL